MEQMLVATMLAFISLMCTCVMLAGSSHNCETVKHAAWGRSEWAIITVYFGTNKVCFDYNDEVEDKQLDSVDYGDEECKEAGKVANCLIGAVFILNFGIFVMSMIRYSSPKSHFFLKATATLSLVLAITCNTLAIGHYDHVCLESTLNGVDRSFSIILGAVMVVLHIINAGVHASV